MLTDLPIDQGEILLPIARAAIATALGRPLTMREDAPWLCDKGATFVTLTQNGDLRGCIGTLVAHRPLIDDVKSNAVAAALRDPRFPPLTAGELHRTRVEVSLLSEPELLDVRSEQDALETLLPHVDGVILEYAHYRGTFLPQVWEQLPEPDVFLAHLKLKAGLPTDFWAPGIRLSRYQVRKWKEVETEEAAP